MGPLDVVEAQVLDVFPTELTDCSWVCAADLGASCSPSGSGDIVDVVDLPSTTSVVYSATCTVATSAGTCSNTATVTLPAGLTDPNPSNNMATDSDHITALADFVFGDDLESGDTGAWTTTVPPIVLKLVQEGAAIDEYRTAFRLVHESIKAFRRFTAPVGAGFGSDGERLFVIDLRRDGPNFAVRVRVWDDERRAHSTDWIELPHPDDEIELRWRRSLSGLADGRIELFVDGLPPAIVDELDNDRGVLVKTVRGFTIDGAAVTKSISATDGGFDGSHKE